MFIQDTRYSFPILMKLEFFRQIFEKSSDIEFQEKPILLGPRCSMWTGRFEANTFRKFTRASKILRCAHTFFFIAHERNRDFCHTQHELFGFFFVTETKNVYCAVGTEPLNIIQVNLIFQRFAVHFAGVDCALYLEKFGTLR